MSPRSLETHGWIEHRVFNPMLYLRNGVGHMIANYHTPVQIGFNGIIRKYEEFLNALDMSEPESLQKKIFYDSVIRTLKAVIAFARRYAALAEKLADEEQDPVRQSEPARNCESVHKGSRRTCRNVLGGNANILVRSDADSNGDRRHRRIH